ncbi:MAG TPA: M23 family metallopeptidase [Spirochaetota bacterium]|nr:M23 family metallopeptidase [Spirochaetota bacterium]
MGIRHHSTARHSPRPSAYVLRNARLKRVKKRVRDFFGTVNRKGHEHITLMIASHSANTPVFTLRISKYIILFIAGVLAVTITFSVSAFIEKGTTDPEIERLERNIERCEETLELFSRNVRTLESSTAKFSDAIKPLAAITGVRTFERMSLFEGASATPGEVHMADTTSDRFGKDIRRLDQINLDILRASQQSSRMNTLIWSMRRYYRFQFFRHIERDPKTFTPSFWPVDNGGTITSPFGQRFNFFIGQYADHSAVDIAHARGTIIRATAPGVVSRVDNEPGGYGLYVEVKHQDGYITRYAHLDRQEVLTGDLVYQGQIIGRMGHTGLATGDHVHYEVVKDGEYLDPEEFMENKFKPWDLPQP